MISKAVALKLRREVPGSGIAAVIFRHFGRRVASSRGARPGVDLTRNANGVAIGRRYDGEDRLMSPRDDNGCSLLHTLHSVFDEWLQWEGPPARGLLLAGPARWATDTRSIGSQSAAKTTQRFARGETAVELYE